MERNELKGKQTHGKWVYGTSKPQRDIAARGHAPQYTVGLDEPGNTENGPTGCSPIHKDVYMSIGGPCQEADAALIAEAGTVANETGLWPLDMVERIKELERLLNGFVINEQHMDDPELRSIRDRLFAESSAILNKKS